MTEWIDFSIYVASNLVLWVLLPLAYRELALPVMMDRNPEWVAANPAAVQRIARSYWFNNSCIGWGCLTVILLLLVQLGVELPGARENAPLWQRLNGFNNLLFAIGFVAFGVVMALVHRKLKKWIPPGVRRSASLQPRTTADSAPFWLRLITEGLTAVLFVTWVVVGMGDIPHSPKFWDGFIFVFVLSAIFAVMGHASARRPPNYMDRLYGAVYRRREVRIIYGLRLAFVAFGAIALTGSVLGAQEMPLNPVRMALLLFQVIFVASLLAFILIKPAGSTTSRLDATGLKASLIMLILVPIIAVASTSAFTPTTCCAASRPSFHAPPAAASADLQWAGRWLR